MKLKIIASTLIGLTILIIVIIVWYYGNRTGVEVEYCEEYCRYIPGPASWQLDEPEFCGKDKNACKIICFEEKETPAPGRILRLERFQTDCNKDCKYIQAKNSWCSRRKKAGTRFFQTQGQCLAYCRLGL